MSEWWTYRLEDFLLFSPRTYWRMFELHNQALWPLQIPALLLGAAILVWVVRTPPWSGRVVSIVLAAAWFWIAWAFLWNRYATINWAAPYAVPAFAVQALLLAWFGGLRGDLHFTANWTGHGVVGLTLLLYAIVLHPLIAILAGRPIEAAEVFGIAPDPTAIATLGLVSMVPGGSAALLLLVTPLAWCVVSWATLHTMGSPEGWLLLAAAVLVATSRIMFRPRAVERHDPGDRCH